MPSKRAMGQNQSQSLYQNPGFYGEGFGTVAPPHDHTEVLAYFYF